MRSLALPSAGCTTLRWLPLSAGRPALLSEGGLQGESRCCWLWARITSPPHAPCPLGVTICLAAAPPSPLGLPQSPSRDGSREPAPRPRSQSLPGAQGCCWQGGPPRQRAARPWGVPGGGSGRREPGIPGEPSIMRRSTLPREAGLPPPFPLPPPPPPPGPAGARVLSRGPGAGPSRTIGGGLGWEGEGGREGERPKAPRPERVKRGANVVGGGGSLV